MTDRLPFLLAALGWCLVLWGLSAILGWWVWPLGLGVACGALAVLLAGWRNVLELAREGGLWYGGGHDEEGEERLRFE